MAGQPKKRAARAAAAAEAAAAKAAAAGGDPEAARLAELRRHYGARKGEKTHEQWQEQRDINLRRVDHIVGLMSAGQWLPGVSHDQLAKQWGVSPDIVHHRAQEAGKVMRSLCAQSAEFQENVRSEVLTTFRVIRGMAMRLATSRDAPIAAAASALQVGLAATRLFGFYTGIEPAKKVEDVTPTADPFEGWTKQEVREFADTGRRPRRALVAFASGNEAAAREAIDTEAVAADGDPGPDTKLH